MDDQKMRSSFREIDEKRNKMGNIVTICCLPKDTQNFSYRSGRKASTREEYAENFDALDFRCNPDKPGNFPYFTLIISIVQSGIFGYYYAQEGSEIMEFNRNTLCSPFLYSPWHRQEFWRYFTYQFNHAGITHLVGNLFFQLVLGTLLEMVHGSWRVISIYFSGVIAGSMLASIFDGSKMLVGASGGDYALVFAFLANLIINWDSMIKNKPWKWLRLGFLILFIGGDVASAVWRAIKTEGTNTSYAAHLGGAIAGLTIGLSLLKNFHIKSWESVCNKIGIAIFIAFIIFAIFWNAFWPGFDKYDDAEPPCEYFGQCTSETARCIG